MVKIRISGTQKDPQEQSEFPQEQSELKLRNVFICHRIPERTFKIRNHYFPVCSRCTGIYIGAFSYFLFAYLFYVQYSIILILSAAVMVMPTFIDGLTQFLGFRESNNILRVTTGLIGGLGLGILVKALKWFLIS